MNRTFKRILAAFLLLCMIPATLITALAHGPGVAGNQTENQWHDLAQGQYIPETVVVDGEFDDAGWAVNEWSYVDSDSGIWDSEAPNSLNATASYKYQLHYDRKYFYFAAVIAMPEGVTKGNFAVYLSETKASKTDHTNRGTTAGFVFEIDVNAEEPVTPHAKTGSDEAIVDAYNNGSYTPSPESCEGVKNVPTSNGGKAYFADNEIKATAENGIVTIEFRNALDATIDMDYTIYGLNKNDKISYYVALCLPHGANSAKNEAGNVDDMLFHPIWSVSDMLDAVGTTEPRGDYWPIKDGGMTPISKPTANMSNISIDGNLEEELWQTANADFQHVNSATGHYFVRPYENDPLSYSFVTYSDGSKLYGAAILDVEAHAPGDGLLGTEFGIWFDNGVDERELIANYIGKNSNACEYQYFKNHTSISIYPDNNPTTNKPTSGITSEDYYATELRYYINHNVNLRLYGTPFTDRGNAAGTYDINPEVAPDYYFNGDDYTIKAYGQHYQYGYKVINGKTYVEFFVDLKSVRCDNGTCRMFVYAQHDTKGSGTAKGRYAKLYYPSLKTDDQQVQNIFWVTNLNGINDRNYGTLGSNGSRGAVNDNLGVLFTSYNEYDKYDGEFKWWHQVCFQKISGNDYKVIQIIPAQSETPDDEIISLDSHPTGNYLWYAMSIGSYYSENYYVGGRKLLAPLDKRNYMCTESYNQIRYWNVGDTVTFNFDYNDITSERAVVRYDGRTFKVDDPDEMYITNQSKVETTQRTIQDVGHTRARYVKFKIYGNGWIWLDELALYGSDGTTQLTVNGIEHTAGTKRNKEQGANDPNALINKKFYQGEFTSWNAANAADSTRYYGTQMVNSQPVEFELTFNDLQDIYRFGVGHSANTQSFSGIQNLYRIECFVRMDAGDEWSLAGTISPGTKNTANLYMSYSGSYIHNSGTDAQAYWNPYTVTHTISEESIGSYYRRRNAFMPSFEEYGLTNSWMYGSTTSIVSAAHIAPDTIQINGDLGDSGWGADKWISADPSVNATYVGKKTGTTYKHQMRTDGEYLYVSALADTTWNANSSFDLWIRYNGDANTKHYHVGNGGSSIPVRTPDSSVSSQVDQYKFEAGSDGWTYKNGKLMNDSMELFVKELNGTAWTVLNYEDSAFYGYTKEILESTSDGIWIWEGRPQTQGFRFGIEAASIARDESANNKKTIVEFKIALDEIGGGNGFKYFMAFSNEDQSTTYYPKIYGTPSELENGQWFNTSKVVTAADLKDGGKLWLRNDYAPMTSLGAKVNDAYGENKVKAIRFAARYTEDFIRRSNAKEGTNYWMVADAGIVILPTAMISETCPLAIENENVAKASARDIVNWKNEAPNGETNFADYESFVFYVNLVGVDNIVDVPLTFSAYIDYYESYNGSETFYSIPLERSYTFVEQTATEGEILLIND